jgi:folate-dependent phosphoribosylglycinamide formyltransferase PurN
MKFWVALFSQTGSEIHEVSEKIGRYPDMILCNKQDDFESINSNLIGKSSITFTDKVPTVDQYLQHIPEDALVTMHGWLRIVPGEVCDKRSIYNGHPGLITEYPQLKGKDPQQKAIDLGLEYSGCILHKATAELDGGPIVDVSDKVMVEGRTTDEVFSGLHEASVNMWVKFLDTKLNECN